MHYPLRRLPTACASPNISSWVFAICLLLLTFSSTSPARAVTTRTVTTFADTINPNDGVLSLREAIANSPAGDIVNFAPNMVGTLVLTNGELAVGRALTLVGPGARKLSLSGNNTTRVFNISGTGAVAISGLTLTRGRAPLENESQYYYGSGYGGAVKNTAPLTMADCTITNSTARGGSGPSKFGGAGGGGGIYNRGTLTLRNCLVSYNSVFSGAPYQGINALAYGGGIHSQAPFTLINTTLTGNLAQYNGGALLAGYSTQCYLTACTISGNSIANNSQPGSSAGVSSHYTSNVQVRSCIIAGNKWGSESRDVEGSYTSLGFNLIGATDNSTSYNYGMPLWLASDLTGTKAAPLNAQLTPLQNNGGNTDTVGLYPASAAINMGDNSLPNAPASLTIDQRGLPRRINNLVDIGAFEVDLAQPGPNYQVNSLDDPGDGIPGANQCTLREALTAMNLQGDANTVSFKVGLTGTIALLPASGQLPISNPVTISGPGARVLAISGSSAMRVFDVSAAGVAISGLTIRDGAVIGTSGSTGGTVMGGAVRNTGTLTLSYCTLLNNRAWGGTGASQYATSTGGNGYGGAVYNTGTLGLQNCTFSANDARGGDAFIGEPAISGSGLGGAVYNYGTATIVNCTLSGNAASAGFYGFGGYGNGAGIYNAGSSLRFSTRSTVTMTNCTVANNRAFGLSGASGGGLYTAAGAIKGGLWSYIRLRNTLVAQNTATTGQDVYGNFASDGFNLVGKTDSSTGWVATDKVGTNAAPLDPRVATALANNGGPTDTLAVLATSPACNAATAPLAPPLDQRGFRRFNQLDIGAFEFGGLP